MIDAKLFADAMGQLGGAFGREIDQPVIRMYYAILSPRMDSPTFATAIEATLARETFWPPPAKILEHAGLDAEDHADAAFRQMSEIVRDNGGFLHFPHELYLQFDAPTRAAIKAVGGLREIAERSGPDKRPALLKRFVRAYNEAQQERAALPSSGPQKHTLQLVRRVARDMALPPGDR